MTGTLAPAQPTSLPSRAAVLAELAAAERAEGWLARCADANRYVALHAPFVDALAAALRELRRELGRTAAPVLELCAGDGALAGALRARGIAVVATDIAPPSQAADVERMAAADALARYAPRIVLGGFVPIDAGVDGAVLATSSVRHYIVLGARLGGVPGMHPLDAPAGWTRRRLSEVSAKMITRHDVWLGDDEPVRTLGEAWCLDRAHPDTDAVAASRPAPTA